LVLAERRRIREPGSGPWDFSNAKRTQRLIERVLTRPEGPRMGAVVVATAAQPRNIHLDQPPGDLNMNETSMAARAVELFQSF